jgi:hypothetical protein
MLLQCVRAHTAASICGTHYALCARHARPRSELPRPIQRLRSAARQCTASRRDRRSPCSVLCQSSRRISALTRHCARVGRGACVRCSTRATRLLRRVAALEHTQPRHLASAGKCATADTVRRGACDTHARTHACTNTHTHLAYWAHSAREGRRSSLCGSAHESHTRVRLWHDGADDEFVCAGTCRQTAIHHSARHTLPPRLRCRRIPRPCVATSNVPGALHQHTEQRHSHPEAAAQAGKRQGQHWPPIRSQSPGSAQACCRHQHWRAQRRLARHRPSTAATRDGTPLRARR